jgi:alkylation response protein AidB-like acyl-CoA dehydrogenase
LPDGWIDAARAGDIGTVRRLRHDLDIRAFVATLGRAGWVTPHWPVEHGGRDLDEAEARAAFDLLDQWSVPRIPRGVGLVLAAPAIRAYASEETKRLFLPRIVTGEQQWAQLFSEPNAGSDLASLATSAVRDGDDWVVNGQKVWTTLGHEADAGMLLARTDPAAPKHRGITYFGLDLHSPGVEVRPLVQMTGETEFSEVFMTDVVVPDLHRISAVNEGWAATHTSLSAERVNLSGPSGRQRQSRGILGGKTLDEVLALAAAVGVAADPVRRDRVLSAYVESRLLALTVERSAAARQPGPAGSVTKISKAHSNQSLQEVAICLRGAAGQAWVDGDTEAAGYVREFLRTRANSIEGGTSEIQRNIVGERVLGLPQEPDPFKGKPWKDVPR